MYEKEKNLKKLTVIFFQGIHKLGKQTQKTQTKSNV